MKGTVLYGPRDVRFEERPEPDRHVHLHGGPAPVRRYLPDLIDLTLKGEFHLGKVFDLTLPLDQGAEGYRAMDERRAIKTLLRP
jgi:threonine dehydrogenase-like Zn-dependent dehydrogenase